MTSKFNPEDIEEMKKAIERWQEAFPIGDISEKGQGMKEFDNAVITAFRIAMRNRAINKKIWRRGRKRK